MTAFDLNRILSETSVAGIDYHQQLGSTSTRALELAAAGIPGLPLLVLADEQIAGRGRGQNQWWAGRGALTFSLIHNVRTDPPQPNWPILALAAGVAVAEAIESLTGAPAVQVKWPNDVYLSGRKICGILVETSPQLNGLVVIGVGINVNNSSADAPAELRPLITSISDARRQPADRTEVLITVLQHLDQWLSAVQADASGLAEAWQARCYLQGRTVQLEIGTQRVIGVCQGIDPGGALLLCTESGIQRYVSGVVARIV